VARHVAESVMTVQLFFLQILNGNTPCTHSRHLAHDRARNDGRSFDSFNSIAILSTERTPHPFTCRY